MLHERRTRVYRTHAARTSAARRLCRTQIAAFRSVDAHVCARESAPADERAVRQRKQIVRREHRETTGAARPS
jgi:hypothetical protein